jgi:eukaryotic-like serine/threonine-protein kinase
MNPSREEALFVLALEKPPEKRGVFLDVMCDGDSALRQRLEALLAAHKQPATELALPAAEAAATVQATAVSEPPDEAVGQTLGRYKLLERVGEGGFGSVWAAEQREPVRRRVALKIIKLGMDTKQVVARFGAERQALALMDHPNIAKVLDAGTTDTGRPFFVMELVKGIPITQYCDHEKLGTKERLDLFIKVCHAIQHAHQKGIIHRDIKPSNIMVTLHDGVPVPKVIDFGIAKATQQELTELTIYTQHHQFIGTPAYMSPEQAEMSGLDIDTRSDIYSLGVLLYELLTGTTPFDSKELMKSGVDEMRKIIREREPVRPSTRLTRDRASAKSPIENRKSKIENDLDWIVMKCLEKDRARRYESANGLAMDLKRHLTSEPVLARPPSTAYRLQKAFRRNRLAFASVAAVGAALVAGVTVSTWQAVDATRAQNTAQLERDNAQMAQRQAEEERLAAEQSRNAERFQRERAEEARRDLRRNSYVSDIQVAHLALQEHNLERARTLLRKYLPDTRAPGPTSFDSPASAHLEDLRGFEWRYLWKRSQGQETYSFHPHPDAPTYSNNVSYVVFSPDGNTFATAGGPNLRVWETSSRRLLAVLAESAEPASLGMHSIAYSPDGKLLAWNDETSVLIWDTSDWQIQRRMPKMLRQMTGAVGRPLAFSPDGRTLASRSGPGVEFWDTTTWTPRPRLDFAEAGDSWLAYSDDGKLATTTRLRVEIWDSFSMAKLAEYGVIRTSGGLKFSPGGRLLALGSYGGTVTLLDLAGGQPVNQWKAHRSAIRGLVFLSEGKILATGGDDQTIRLWDVAGALSTAPRLLSTLVGHQHRLWGLSVSHDGQTLVSASSDGTVKFWNPTSTAERLELKNAALPAGFSADGGMIATADTNLVIQQWQVATGGAVGSHPPVVDPEMIQTIRLSPDGSTLAVALTNGPIELWDLHSRRRLRTLSNDEPVYGGAWTGALSEALKFSDDQQWLVSAHVSSATGRASHAKLWNAARGQIETSFPLSIGGMAFSADEKLFAAAGANLNLVHVWDIATHRELQAFPVEGYIYALAFSPDGKSLAIGSGALVLHIADLSSEKPPINLSSHVGAILSLAFAPDGKTLATASADGTVKFWNTTLWQELMSISDYGKRPDRIMFSPDGTTLAVGSQEGSVQLWRAPSMEEIAAAEAQEKVADKKP